jgi:hypothetical protein
MWHTVLCRLFLNADLAVVTSPYVPDTGHYVPKDLDYDTEQCVPGI